MPEVIEAPTNGSELPNASSSLKGLTDEELMAIANQHHAAYGQCLRKAIKDHARLAGQALVELKDRHKSKFGAWLKQNFKGSPKTARAYMRVARNWKQIHAAGLDREDVTLAQLRAFLARTTNIQPSQKQTTKPVLETAVVDDAGQPAPDPFPVPRQFALNADDADEFDDMVANLMPVFHTTTVADTVLEAVRFCYKVKFSDQ